MSHPINPAAAHPSDLELDLSRTGEAGREVEAHVASCPSCAARREALDDFARALRGPTPLVPAAREDALLARMRQRVGDLRARRRVVRALRLAPVAAAAVVLLALAVVREARHDARDVDGDGRFDVLDAFALARAVEQGTASGSDVNGDGRVDREDVAVLARAAVAVSGRS